MVSLLTWVAVGILLYAVVVFVLDRRGVLPESVRVSGPITTLRTRRGRDFLDWLARPRRFWRAWANFGVGMALVVMFGAFVFLLLSAISAVQNPPEATAVNQPRNVLVIPGVNDFLPLSVAPEIVLGLAVGLVVHEGGHGLLCRVEDIDIRSMGLAFLAFIPIGAFVEPEEESRDRANRGARTRMFAAGVTNNFAVTIVAFGLLFGPVVGSIATAPGAGVGGVVPNSSADTAGLERGDRITAIEGHPVDAANFSDVLAERDQQSVTVTVNGDERRAVERRVLVTAVTEGSPANLSTGDRVRTVDGQSVRTERALQSVLSDTEQITVETDGATTTFAAGAFVEVVNGGPLNRSGAPATTMVITYLNGTDGDTRVSDTETLIDRLDETAPDDEVTVAAYVDDERREYEVTLAADDDGSGFVGIRGFRGITGLSVDDFGVRTYPAGAYLDALGGDGDGGEDAPFGALQGSFFGLIIVALFLPLSAVVGSFPFNFAGFTETNRTFYEAVGPLAGLDGGVFVLANVLFWIGWINVQLGFFNCIPALPLDGGRILRTSSEAVASRLPIDASQRLITTVTAAVGLVMVGSFLLLILGPQFLA